MPSTRKNHPKKKQKYTIKRFAGLVNKPDISKKGITYSIEKSENIDEKTGKKTEGDIFKKYQDENREEERAENSALQYSAFDCNLDAELRVRGVEY